MKSHIFPSIPFATLVISVPTMPRAAATIAAAHFVDNFLNNALVSGIPHGPTMTG